MAQLLSEDRHLISDFLMAEIVSIKSVKRLICLKKLKYRIFYPGLKNIDLIKESGMIAHFLCQNQRFQVSLVSFANEDFTNLKLLDSKVKIHYIKKFSHYDLIDTILYLIKIAKQTDILQLFHLNKTSVALATIYKMFNPGGFVYIKLDTDIGHLGNLLITNGIKGRLRKTVLKKFINLVSTETKLVYTQLYENWGDLKAKLVYLPNGIWVPEMVEREKEKIILTVGRIGAYEKGVDILLKALENISLNDWKVYVIGPVEPLFEDYLKGWFKQHPTLKDKVIIMGPVRDRDRLFEFYSKAAIFCLPSRWESFGFAILEAAYFGCYLVVTPVGAASDILEVTNYGNLTPIEDVAKLQSNLSNAMNSWSSIQERNIRIRNLVDSHFSWKMICDTLAENIMKRIY